MKEITSLRITKETLTDLNNLKVYPAVNTIEKVIIMLIEFYKKNN